MRKINVYVKTIEQIVDGSKKTFNVWSSTVVNKDNPGENLYIDVRLTKRCQKDLPDYNAEIEFDVANSYYKEIQKEENGKIYTKRILYLDDFTVIKEIPKKVTTDDDLPF